MFRRAHASNRPGIAWLSRPPILRGATLVTAEVLYYMPDHPKLLQTFMWQTMDFAPKYPRLSQFLDFWKREIEAAIHSVRVAHADPFAVPAWRHASGLVRLH